MLPPGQRREAVAIYLQTGSQELTAQHFGVTRQAVAQWSVKPWFAELVDELKEGIDAEQKALARQLIRNGQIAALERLENGDEVLTKDGQVVRLKMRGRDAAVIGAIWLDKLRLMEGRATRITAPEAMSGVLEQFQKMAEQYREKRVDGSVVSVVNAAPKGAGDGGREGEMGNQNCQPLLNPPALDHL